MRDIGQVLRASASTLPTPPTSGAERLAERAEREGLIDVAFTTIDSPLGELIAAASPEGLVRLCYRELTPHADRLDSVLDELARRISPRILEAPRRMDRVRRELEEYFDGRRKRFDVPLDLRTTGGFTGRVLRATSRIPYGRVHTYAEMAALAGNARATRAAG